MKKLLPFLMMVFIFTACGKKDDSGSSDGDAPVIISAYPNNNAVTGPVLIEGKFDVQPAIKFNDKAAISDTFVIGSTLTDLAIPLDAGVTGIVTTRVPAGLSPGVVKLTITTSKGTSKTFDFTVLGPAPTSPTSPVTIKVKPKAKYIPAVFNFWTNEYGSSSVFIKSSTNEGQPSGDQTLTLMSGDATTNNFVVTHFPASGDATDKTINILVTHKDGSTEILKGIYADSDLLPKDKPAWHRIIFYDKKQAAMVNKVFFPAIIQIP